MKIQSIFKSSQHPFKNLENYQNEIHSDNYSNLFSPTSAIDSKPFQADTNLKTKFETKQHSLNSKETEIEAKNDRVEGVEQDVMLSNEEFFINEETEPTPEREKNQRRISKLQSKYYSGQENLGHAIVIVQSFDMFSGQGAFVTLEENPRKVYFKKVDFKNYIWMIYIMYFYQIRVSIMYEELVYYGQNNNMLKLFYLDPDFLRDLSKVFRNNGISKNNYKQHAKVWSEQQEHVFPKGWETLLKDFE